MPKISTYTTEIPPVDTQATKTGEGLPRRHVLFAEKLSQHPAGVTNLYDNFRRGLSISKDANFMGTRQIVSGVAMDYEWMSYSEADKHIRDFAAGLVTLGALTKDTNVGLFSINRAEWIIAEQACFHQSYVTVPLYDTLGPDAIEFIITQTEMPVIVATADKAKTIIDLAAKVTSVKHIVVMNGATPELIEAGNKVNISVHSMAELEEKGRNSPVEPVMPSSESIATICYTSGTTGLPKGVMLTHGNLLAFAAAVLDLVNKGRVYRFDNNDVHISYLPLAHIFERCVQCLLVHVGASFGFYQGDTLKLMDDIAALKPTIFASVPRLYNRIYDKVLAGVKAKGGLAAALFEKAFAAKQQGLKNGCVTHWLWDRLVFGKVRQRLGGRVKVMLTGAAPISKEVLDFLRICFSVELYEGYGQTETSSAIALTDRYDLDGGHCGGPFPCTEVKLVDVPSMNYTSADKPNPRGEICVRGNSIFKGYYKDEVKTKEAIDEDGWCHTGDVGMWDEQGRLKIIDRVKNIFKLAQGEYVAPEKIETVYIRHELVAQVFVYGDSLQSTLVAVVVPDEETFVPWAKASGYGELTFAEYCVNEDVKNAVMKALESHAKASHLKGFEIAKNIHLHHIMFTHENGLLTPTFKLKRHEAKKHFSKEIDAMYNSSGNAAN